jgi:hypothetical protein
MVKFITIINIIIKKIKWPLILLCLIFIVVNYFVLMDLIEGLVIVPLRNYLQTLGCYIDIQKIFSWVFQKILPAIPFLSFFIKIEKENFRNKINNFYSTINILQLLLLTVLLPFLLYMQNKGLKIMYNLKENNNPINELWKIMTIKAENR